MGRSLVLRFIPLEVDPPERCLRGGTSSGLLTSRWCRIEAILCIIDPNTVAELFECNFSIDRMLFNRMRQSLVLSHRFIALAVDRPERMLQGGTLSGQRQSSWTTIDWTYANICCHVLHPHEQGDYFDLFTKKIKCEFIYLYRCIFLLREITHYIPGISVDVVYLILFRKIDLPICLNS